MWFLKKGLVSCLAQFISSLVPLLSKPFAAYLLCVKQLKKQRISLNYSSKQSSNETVIPTFFRIIYCL